MTCKFCKQQIDDDNTRCPFCGKELTEKIDVVEETVDLNVNEEPEAANDEQLKEIKKIRKRGLIALVIMAVIFVGYHVINHIYSENQTKRFYLMNVEDGYEEINMHLDNGDHSRAISVMKDIEERFTPDDDYYKYLPEEHKMENGIAALKEQIAVEVSGKITELNDRLESKSTVTYSADYDDFSKLKDYLSFVISNYTYLNSNKNVLTETQEEYSKKHMACMYTQAILLYENGDKADGIAILKSLDENYKLDSEMAKIVKQDLNTMIANSRATDFEIISGSANVTVLFGGRNYSLTCPKCGYKSDARGTSNIVMNIGKHYAGEVVTESFGMVCASSFQGGCREMSPYTLTIRYK